MMAPRGPSRSRTSRRPLYRIGQLVRGLLAALLLLAMVAGIPWGLATYVGWPLPSHWPTWSETQTILLTPLSTSVLLHILACALWPTWTAFVVDLARMAIAIARTPHLPSLQPSGPLHAVAAALLPTILLAVMNSRAPQPGESVEATTSAEHPAAANRTTAPDRPSPHPATAHDEQLTGNPKPRTPRYAKGTVTVRPPQDGIHDSLWRIADRELGDGTRWPTLFTLNEGRIQADGRALTTPNLLRPGWILHIPSTPRPPDEDDHPPPRTPKPPPSPPSAPSNPEAQPPSASPTPSAPEEVSPTPDHRDRDQEDEPHLGPGVDVPGGAFVPLVLATAIAAVWLTVRWRRRIRYRPGSGARDDVTIAPVVRALRLAHDHAHATGGDNGRLPADDDSVALPQTGRVIAVKDGHALALDLARTRGLGLVGPGALDALRALSISLLIEPPLSRAVDLLVPAADAPLLFGDQDGATQPTPARLHFVDTLDAALERMEAELLTRTRTCAAAHHGTGDASGRAGERELVLLASPTPHAQRRLQAVLDNGSTMGLSGILLGQWRPGVTAHVRVDGTVTATSDSLAGSLTGSRLFTLPAPDSQTLLDLLTEADRDATQGEPQPTELPGVETGPDVARSRPARNTSTSEFGRAHPPVPGPGERGPAPAEPLAPQAPVRSAQANTFGVGGSAAAEPSSSAEGASDGGEQHVSSDTHPESVDPAVTVTVLGSLQIHHHDGDHHQDVTVALAPRQRDVLIFLAVHPDGVRRETLAVTLWPDAPSDRPYNALHATVSQLRRAMRTATGNRLDDLIVHHDGHYSLNPDQVSVDLWHLHAALHSARAENSTQHRLEAVHRLADLYRGDLADDLTAEWIEAPREALRRDVLDAVSALARALADTDPEEALRLLERARTLDRYNEALYRNIARLQARLDRHDAIHRTFALLTTTLAELGEQPSTQTTMLRESLSRLQPVEPSSQTDS